MGTHEIAQQLYGETNFKTAHETRIAIKDNLNQAAGFAKEIIKLSNSVTTDKGEYKDTINYLNDQGIENKIMYDLDNRMGLVCEYIRDLAKFKKIDALNNEKENHEFISENLEDEK